MKKEKLDELRNKLTSAKNELNDKGKRIKELENTLEVKEYLLLRNLQKADLTKYKLSEEDFISKLLLYRFFVDDNETNNINNSNDFVYQSNIGEVNNLEYLYTNIENGHEEFVKEDKIDEFENNHIILDTEVGYYKVCSEFILDMVNTNEEDAVKRIIKKYGKR